MNKMFMLYVHVIALDKGCAYDCTDRIFLCWNMLCNKHYYCDMNYSRT